MISAKKALVIGLGISGRSASRFLLSLGYKVTGVDQKKIDPILGLEVLEESKFTSLEGFSLVVPSPGVPSKHPLIEEALSKGIEVIGEAELALRHMKQKAVAITGTNGKTTVTSMVEHVLCSSGKKAKAVGNIGSALTEYVLLGDLNEIAVVELSSYQLETLSCAPFQAAVILNITPDHLDRYGTMQEYALAKIKIEKCVKPGGALYVYKQVAKEYGQLFTLPYVSFGAELTGHDLINERAAWLLCKHLGVSEEAFQEALKSFKKPSHRIEFVKVVGGVHYYDDSKGTNIDAVIKAVESLQGNVVLIAGGVDKGSSYMPWKEAFQDKVRDMVLIGQAAPKIKEELALFFNVKIVDSLESAVDAASKIARPGDAVLLSPGCSSFDMFRDYVHRGKEFQRFVGLLGEES